MSMSRRTANRTCSGLRVEIAAKLAESHSQVSRVWRMVSYAQLTAGWHVKHIHEETMRGLTSCTLTQMWYGSPQPQ